MRKQVVDITGKTFSRLTAIRPSGHDKNGRVLWECQCSCGEVRIVSGKLLRSGNTKSCGCLQREKASARAKTGITTTHGHSSGGIEHPAYNVWRGMHQRCGNPNHPSFRNYGGRGIQVCSRWETYDTFLADMGNPPPGMTLDRIDTNQGYGPENCRWATWATQSRNKRTNRVVSFRGATMVVRDWSVALGVHYATLSRRLKDWGVERALASYNP